MQASLHVRHVLLQNGAFTEVSTAIPCRTSLHQTMGVKTFDLRPKYSPLISSRFLLLATAFDKLRSVCVRLAAAVDDTVDEGHSEAASCDNS